MPEKTLILKQPGYLLRVFLLVILPVVCMYDMRELSINSMMFPGLACLIILGVGIKNMVFPLPEKISEDVSNLPLCLKIVGILLLFCAVLEVIGFYAAIFLLSCYFYQYFDSRVRKRNIPMCVLVALLITGIMYVFIFYVLQLQMHECILF